MKGKVVRVVPEDEMVDALLEWAEKIVTDGVEAALDDADEGAAAEAEKDRLSLLDEQGTDANQSEQKIERIERLRKPDPDDPALDE